ncbi:toxin-antitoxin system HicB family antitoxin [Altererythrobacter sp. KTW20L]|uniref:toxin-antitoxin system HicB family antitoxin n=1 Tax=Altererythrobacter sp. KTW20L TaxID=2942210 RepID=UPI0020BD5EDF|nr:toxin-antitoxin system HicB family antitoxin [Altererythrobacter sp. KTW20L]MCL6250177.1 toxin-antitoxin system HicB family antitoxin [Altererythrobacter sp. KTW20L]
MAPPPRKPFPLRLDPALHAALERVAAADFRSVNAEVEVLLREALGRRGIKVGQSETPRRGRPRKESEESE